MRKLIPNIILFSLLIIFLNKDVYSWDDGVTHKDLSEYAAKSSVLSNDKGGYLKNLGFNIGLDEVFTWQKKKYTVTKWLREGAELEDAGSDWGALTGTARYVNHFHNPIKAWNSAGLTDMQLRDGESTLLWAQDSAKQADSIEEDWSWEKIRQVYYWALISPTEEQRQLNFAQTFRGLGHQMHLIQDMAQPAHVRNDAHPIDGKGWMDGLETWTKKNLPTLQALTDFSSAPVLPKVNLSVDIVYEGNRYAPITQFVDTNQYNGFTPGVSLTWGLSEYTNSNFVSDDSIFTENFSQNNKHYFPYPRYSPVSYEMYEIDLPDFKKRIYLKKQGDGENIEHFATAGPLYKYLDFDPVLQRDELKLDPAVHSDYAQKLIPRAVGYSAGLLNYFFRGDITLDFDFDAGYGYMILNNTQEEMEGLFEVYYDDIYDQRQLLWSGDLLIKGNYKSATISFDSPVFPKEPDKYILVFSGRIGSEYNAVAGKVVVMPDMEMRSAHFIVFRDWDSRIRDNQTGEYKYPSMIGWPYFYPKFEESGDDRSGYYDTQSILMVTAAKKSMPEDWGYPDNTMYYWKFRNVSGQAKLVQEGTEPGDRRLYHKAVVNVDGRSFTVNRIERSQYYENFITHSTYGNDYGFVYHTDDPLNEKYVDDGYDAVVGQCDSSSIFMNIYWSPRRYLTPPVVNAIYLYNNDAFTTLGALDNDWFARRIQWDDPDTWRVFSFEEENADLVELYSAHAPMYPPEPF